MQEPTKPKPALFVKPKSPDTVVRFPGTRLRLPVDGAAVPRIGFWMRALRRGDVVPAEDQPQGSHTEAVSNESEPEQAKTPTKKKARATREDR